MGSAHAGYGFSSSPTKRGFGVSEIAKTFNELMLKLGYDTYVAQGGHMSCLLSSLLAHCVPCAPCLNILHIKGQDLHELQFSI